MATRRRHDILTDIERIVGCISKLEGESTYHKHRAETIWSCFGVYATPTSSLYSESFYHENNLGKRYFGHGLAGITSVLNNAEDHLRCERGRMKDWKWYILAGKSKLEKNIASLEEDVRLLSLIIQQYNKRKDDLNDIAEKNRIIKERLRRMYECGRLVNNELREYDLHKLFDDCDAICPQHNV